MPYLGLLVTALLVTAIVDIARADEKRIRGFGRTQWTLVVVLAPVAGALAWLIAGRPAPDRVTSAAPTVDDAAEEEFRRQCRERAETQRRAARSQRDNSAD
ncbi:PLD nuclease N-terminal domain-containing protein [Mycolicibacterium sp. 120266]|uniref:PLD nuclease N-terminal domain-containing protein n=1 Tax=Mycolicibacterium sp. 120266 TaxID=3090601 RepID=UPI00299DEE28|nr:PLD nuclease N-terminal domain-containing protein [Mycolicibacterium sp. 120266]MDX1874621.1 PLD nuclease N-terminal domain-containing protein [Mycolicibacterium sp. 120266]